MTRSNLWPVVRLRKLNKERWLCQTCPETAIRSRQIHHIKPFARFPHLELTEENLVSLCPDCHATLHKVVNNVALLRLITLYNDRRFLGGYRLDFGPVPHQFSLELKVAAANDEVFEEDKEETA
jgi:HNH endonuclease